MGWCGPLSSAEPLIALVACAFIAFAPGDLGARELSRSSNVEEVLGTRMAAETGFGLRIKSVSVRLDTTTGDDGYDMDLVHRVEEVGAGYLDAQLQDHLIGHIEQGVRRLPGIARASIETYESIPQGQIALLIRVAPAGRQEQKALQGEDPVGASASATLPVIYQDQDTQIKFILNGGFGAYATSHPFFGHADQFTRGNIAARDPAGVGTTSWVEGYIEPGLGGVTRLGDSPLYAYGSATFLASGSKGQDVYDSGTRLHGAFEQAYGGLLLDLPGKGNRVKVSAGRQIYQLRQGFLISKIPGSTNLGKLGAVWLGPRLAFDKTLVAELKSGTFNAEAILLEPTEYPGLETGTRLTGATVGYNDGKRVDAALTYLTIPRSRKAYLDPDGNRLGSREGLRTISPSVWLTSPLGIEGLWFKAEAAWQTHDTLDLKANAFALWPGYRANHLPWKPGISYRISRYSGDNPATTRFERYDPLLSGGQNNYVTGMLLSGAVLSSNLRSHRLTVTANPTEQVALTLEYTLHKALYLNNRGGIGPLQQLASRDLAKELDLFVNVYVGRNLYMQGLLAVAKPGEAIKQAVDGRARNWYATQFSLYYFF